MKKLARTILFTIVMMAATGGLYAETVDVYVAVPIIIDRTDGKDFNATAIGGGVKFSTAEHDDKFGLAAALTAYYPLAVSWTQGSGVSTSSVSDVYSVPLGLDLQLGVDINTLRLAFLTFPLGIGFHSKVDFYEPGPQINFGIVGSVGAKLNLGEFGIFARALVSYDFYGTQYVKANSKWDGGVMNHWGIQPQIGVSFSD